MTGDTNPGRPSENPDSLAALLRSLQNDATTLLRQEVALARQEMSEKASEIARTASVLVAGSLVAHAGALLIILSLAAMAYALLARAGVSPLVAGWLAPLLVGLIIVGIGYALITKALASLKDITLTPERTVETLQSSKEWIKEKVTR